MTGPQAAIAEQKLLGFDFGVKKTGVAVGQSLTDTATPLTTLRSVNNRPDWNAISALIRAWRPSALVVGIPYNIDGADTDCTAAAQRFKRQLENRYELPVHAVDERLSSLAAERMIRAHANDSGHPRLTRKKRLARIDQVAAKLILETWLTENRARRDGR